MSFELWVAAIVIGTVALYAVYLIVASRPKSSSSMATAAPPAAPAPLRNFTKTADGIVFDVSRGRTFYGPGACDATIGLATSETDSTKWSKTSVDELTAAERDVLAEWVGKYHAKYDVVGYLTEGANPKSVPVADVADAKPKAE